MEFVFSLLNKSINFQRAFMNNLITFGTNSTKKIKLWFLIVCLSSILIDRNFCIYLLFLRILKSFEFRLDFLRIYYFALFSLRLNCYIVHVCYVLDGWMICYIDWSIMRVFLITIVHQSVLLIYLRIMVLMTHNWPLLDYSFVWLCEHNGLCS
jgi:hypothetical protein